MDERADPTADADADDDKADEGHDGQESVATGVGHMCSWRRTGKVVTEGSPISVAHIVSQHRPTVGDCVTDVPARPVVSPC